MKFDTIKKSHKKEILIGGIAVLGIVSALTFVGTRAKYKTTESIKLVQGNVVYKVPDLRIVAVKTSEDGTNYEDAEEIPASGYTLNTTNSICRVYDGTTTPEEAPKDENVTIEYTNGKVNILNVTKRNTRCYLYFDKINGITVDDIIAANNPKSETPNFANAATTDEGVYSVSDGMYGGTSYYWRGAVTNNYVKFAEKCWRIVRINGDKSIRLIYDGSTCHANGTSTTDSIIGTYAYNKLKNRSEYVGWTYVEGKQRPDIGDVAIDSDAKKEIEKWYNNAIGSNDKYSKFVVNGKFCNNRNVQAGQQWHSNDYNQNFNYETWKRLERDRVPTLSCNSTDIYIVEVGMITADEVYFAGGRDATNKQYYLYNDQNLWTMTPFCMNAYDVSNYWVSTDGYIGYNYTVDNLYGLRPVINLRSDIIFSNGTGTLNNPYIVAD